MRQAPYCILSKVTVSDIQRWASEICQATWYQLCKQKDQVVVLELSVQPDHVHLVVGIPLKYMVPEFMGYLKGKLALRLF